MDPDSDPLIINEDTTLSRMSKAVRGIFTLNSVNSTNLINSTNSVNQVTQDIHNNWTNEMNSTLESWKLSLSHASFIYQYVKEIKKKKLTKLSLISFVLTVIAATISGATSLAISSDTQPYKTIALILSVITFCITSASTIINGIITKIYKLDTDVEQYTKYIENIDELYSVLTTMSEIPTKLREDAIIFIQRESKRYNELIRKGPDIDNKLYLEADKKYNDFLKKEYDINIA